MCNEYKTLLQIPRIRELANSINVLLEAEVWEQRGSVRPSEEALVIWTVDGEAFLGVATFGYPKTPRMGKGLMLNARSETIATTWPWRDMIPCWLPATSWIEYPEVNGKGVRTEVGLPDGEPFLLAGVCEPKRLGKRMAMQMQEPPAHLAHVGTRLPLAYAFDAIGSPRPVQIMERMEIIG